MARPKGIPASNKIQTPINDLEFLKELYITQKKTAKEIAKEFSVSVCLVKERVALLKEKIPHRGEFPKKYNLDIQQVLEFYIKKKMPMREIASLFGCSEWVVLDCLTKTGIKKRTLSDYPHPMLGRKMSENSRKRMSLAKLKIPESEWRGFTEPHSRKLNKSPEWNSWRKKVFMRDYFKCCLCGNKKHLQGHHILMRSVYPEYTYDIHNGITLCKSCHDTIRFKENQYVTKFSHILHEQANARYSGICSLLPSSLTQI